MILNPARLAVRRENPGIILPTYYTTWQAPAETVGAQQVADSAGFNAALATAYAACTTSAQVIELTTAGTYTLSATLFAPNYSLGITIVGLEEGCIISGAVDIRSQNSDYGLTFIGVQLQQGMSAQAGAYYVYRAAGLCQRCLFNPTANRESYLIYNTSQTKIATFEACIFNEAATSAIVQVQAWAPYWIFKNCVFYMNAQDYETIGSGHRATFWNCAFFRATGEPVEDVSCDGDYNIETGTQAPGANTLHSQVWGTHFDANFLPLSAAAKAGGSVANAASVDYLGNVLTGLSVAPIGAIIAV